MKRDFIKRIVVLTLAVLVATAGLPLNAFAESITIEVKEFDKLIVQHYDVSNDTSYPETSGEDAWRNVKTTATLLGEQHKKNATHGDSNWLQETGENVFLNQRSDTTKTAYVATGFLKLDTPTKIKVLVDDGVELTIGDLATVSSWDLQINGETPVLDVPAGEHSFALTYFNWGGDGQLIIQESQDGITWSTIESSRFYIKKTLTKEVPTIGDLKLNDSTVVQADTQAEESDTLSVEVTGLSDGWTAEYNWYHKKFNPTTSVWDETIVNGHESYDINNAYGEKVGLKLTLKLDGNEYETYDLGSVSIVNLYITNDDKHDLYINGQPFALSGTNGNDSSWSTVDKYYLSPDAYQSVPLFAVKGWDNGDGFDTISGFRLAYYGFDSSQNYNWLSTGKDTWYEWHGTNDAEGSVVVGEYVPTLLNSVPTDYRSFDWFSESYKGTWAVATPTASEVSGWATTSAKFPTVSTSDWIWSEYYRVTRDLDNTKDGNVTRFNSPVFFRNRISEDVAPTITATDVVLVQGTADELISNHMSYSDDVDSLTAADLTIVIEDGPLRIIDGMFDTNQSGVSKVVYTITDGSGLTNTATQTVTVTKKDVTRVEVGTTSNGGNLDGTYDRLVLLAQMQGFENEVVANLRNNILMGDVNHVRNNTYTISPKAFTSKVEVTSGSAVAEINGYLALEAGKLLDIDGNIIGESETVVIDLHDDLKDDGTDYNDATHKEDRINAPEWHQVDFETSITDAVVFAQIASVTGNNFTHARVKNINSTSFDVFLEEWNDHLGTNHHNHELVSYLAIKPGKHKVNAYFEGKEQTIIINVYKDGGFATKQENEGNWVFTESAYKNDVKFKDTPIVMSQVQTYDIQSDGFDEQVWMRQQNADYNSVELYAQHDDGNAFENVAVLVAGLEAESDAPVVTIAGLTPYRTAKNAVTISTTDESTVEKIFHSLDGINYSETIGNTVTFNITGDEDHRETTVYAKAVDEYGNVSEPVSKVFVYDNVPPTLNFNPITGSFNTDLHVDITSDDGSITYSTSKDGPFVPYTKGGLEMKAFINDLTVGQAITIYAKAVDEVGNMREGHEVYTHDPTIPKIKFGSQPTKFIEPFGVELISETNDDIYFIVLDEDTSEEPTISSEKYDPNNKPVISSTKTVKALAIDGAGNISGVISRTFAYSPTISIIEEGDEDSVILNNIALRYGYQVAASEGFKDLGSMTNPIPGTSPNMLNIIGVPTWSIQSGDEFISFAGTKVKYDNISKDGTATIRVSVDYMDGDVKKTITADATVSVDFVPTPSTPAPSTPDSEPTQTSTSTGTSVAITPTPIELEVGTEAKDESKSIDLDARVSGSTNANVTWSVGDEAIATVDGNGVITAVKAGETTVTVTHNASGVSKTEKVTVFLVGDDENPLGLVEFFDPYIQGYPDQSFRPKNAVTRAEIATMFAKILKLNIDYPGLSKYNDVPNNQWYFTYVQAATRAGLFNNDGTGNFRPDEAITRAELASVFAKYWDFQNVKVDATKVFINDIDESYWAAKDIYRIYNAGVVKGFEDNTFRPDESTLREHVVGMINTLIARPEFKAETSKFTDINSEHWAYGNIEAASQAFADQKIAPIEE